MSDARATSVTIGWLYPEALSTYGDRGNVLTLVKRAEWRGIKARVARIGRGDPIPANVDILFIGGGQDRAQSQVARTLAREHGDALRGRLSEGCSLLAVCGGYQLLGHEYLTLSGECVLGIGVFDVVTRASDHRLVGEVRIRTRWGSVEGFENHSGRTYLGSGAEPLGRVEIGGGNNGVDGTEGVVSGRAVGTYLHGPVLPRNPELADWLLLEGLRRRDPTACLDALPGDWEHATRRSPRARHQARQSPVGQPPQISRREHRSGSSTGAAAGHTSRWCP